MKIGFYLANAKIDNVAFDEPELGNPGIGGSHFLIGVLPYYMRKFAGDALQPILYANDTKGLAVADSDVATDVLEAMEKAKSHGCDCFIDIAKERPIEVVAQADRLELSTIFWIHNVVRHSHLRAAARSQYLRRVVCTGAQVYDYLRDHYVAPKLTLITNGFDTQGFKPNPHKQKDGRTVVYLGNIVKQKGFHILARAWPRVLQRHPDARLQVIGTGQLYDRSVPLGPWGVATESYERKFLLPYLAGSDGQPHPSVEFLGLLGHERVGILQNAAVGVVNPSGETENCPGSALEFQAAGTPVVSGAYWGLLDTVEHGRTGLLGRTDADLVDNICALLDSPERAAAMGRAGIELVERRHNYREVVRVWQDTIREVCAEEPARRRPVEGGLNRHAKWLRVANEGLKRGLPFLRPLPSVAEAANFARGLKRAARRTLRSVIPNRDHQ